MLKYERGCLFLVGDAVDAVLRHDASYADDVNFLFRHDRNAHMTLLTKHECRTLTKKRIPLPFTNRDFPCLRFVDLGIGRVAVEYKNSPVLYNVIFWPGGARAREELGLEPKCFHITRSVTDVHGVDKSFRTLVRPRTPSREEVDFILSHASVCPPALLEHVFFLQPTERLFYHLSFPSCGRGIFPPSEDVTGFCIAQMYEHPTWCAPYIRYGDALFRTTIKSGREDSARTIEAKEAMLCFSAALSVLIATDKNEDDGPRFDIERRQRLRAFVEQRMILLHTNTHTEWGGVFSKDKHPGAHRAPGTIGAPRFPILRRTSGGFVRPS